jgi:uncharacterized membrane protein (DUF4010 family)
VRAGNLLLIGAVVVCLGFGAYVLGRAIIDTGHEYASLSSGETNSTTTTSQPSASAVADDRRQLQIRVGLLSVAALAGVIAIGATVGAVSRSRRRERWRG